MTYVAKPTTFTVDTVDWKDHVIGVSLTSGEDLKDARTFGAPRASTTGGGMDSVTIHMKWSAAAQALITAEAGDDVVMAMEANGGSWGATIHVPDAPATPELTLGEVAEMDLVCGVVTAIAYTPPA